MQALAGVWCPQAAPPRSVRLSAEQSGRGAAALRVSHPRLGSCRRLRGCATAGLSSGPGSFHPTLKPGARVCTTAQQPLTQSGPDAELFYPGRTDDGLVLPPLPRVLAARGGAGSPGGGAAGSEGSPSYTEHKAKTPPPDLPSLLLDSRIVYLGMPVSDPGAWLTFLASTHSLSHHTSWFQP